jgi:NAD(P)-dependent dehydrogenase (short-subunit alcohol dehydrogenase family)
MTAWTTADIPSQQGRLAVVTGATGGLGYETALALAAAGAEVILTGRNAAKGDAALAKIRTAHPTAAVRYEHLDLASLDAVADFVERFSQAHDTLDLLVNNAGVMSLPARAVTKDGFEMQMGTNYLGHFALTSCLLSRLRKSPRARVVNLSSLAHRPGKIHFDDMQWERGYSPWRAYTQSKLAMLMFTFELQRRSDANGWGLMSNAAHPGYARTDLIANGPGNRGWQQTLGALMQPMMSHSAAAGSLPTLFAATAPQAKPAGYYGPDGFYELKGPVKEAFVARQARDHVVAARLWEASEQLTDVTWPSARGEAR